LNPFRKLLAHGAERFLDLDKKIRLAGGRYVMCYHRVISATEAQAEWLHDSMWVSPETFAEQVEWMKSVGEIVPYNRTLDPTPTDHPEFVITFDDGWRDNYTNAFPVLRSAEVPAIIFVVTSVMESGCLIWPEDIARKTSDAITRIPENELAAMIASHLSESIAKSPTQDIRACLQHVIESLKKIDEKERADRISSYFRAIGAQEAPLTGYMINWDEAREMLAAGIAFGSHTHTHRIFSESTDEQVTWELETSRRIMGEELGLLPDAFAYPNARYRGSEGRLLDAAGFRFGFRLHNLPMTDNCDPFLIPRFICSQRSADPSSHLKLKLLQAPLFRG
jgi:peptidoglycan/xylan/chitin deacetylase (PgdA/CDA1 family)